MDRSEIKMRPVFHILNDEEINTVAAADDGDEGDESDQSEVSTEQLQGDEPRQNDNNNSRRKLNMALSSK